MFATTLRIEDDLGRFLQEAARRGAQSVNAFLADLLRRERDEAIRRGWAADWSAYAQDDQGQDVSYALAAQAELAAEPGKIPHRSPKGRKR